MGREEAVAILEELGYTHYIEDIFIKIVKVNIGDRLFVNQFSVSLDLVCSVQDFKEYDKVIVFKTLNGIHKLYCGE